MKKLTKQEHQKYLDDWVARGGLLTIYLCNHCGEKIKTAQSGIRDCGSKGFWDSVKVCDLCSGLNFVAVWPSGKTESFKM